VPNPGILDDLKRIALEAGRIAQAERQPDAFTLKPDGSIVTRGDVQVERFLRDALPALVPGSTVWGEEEGHAGEGPEGLWCVDPVDGTSNYAHGSPLWGVSIALVRAEAELGAIYLPDLKELFLAARGHGAFFNDSPIAPIEAGPIEPFHLVSYSEHVLPHIPLQRLPGKMRCSGAFVVDGAFTVLGRYRGLIGVREKLYDIAATLALASEVGADIRFASGEPMSMSDLKLDRPVGRPWVVFPRDSGFFA